MPGISTLVVCDLSDGLGIAILINADSKDDVYSAIISQLAQQLFGTDLDVRKRSTSPTISRRSSSSLAARAAPVPIQAYSGTYHNAGYGTFTLCDSTSTSPSCRRTLQTFAIVDGRDSDPSVLYSTWPRMWSSHLRLTRIDDSDSQFDLVFTNLYPTGYGRNTTPFEFPQGEIVVEFVVAKGKVSGVGLIGTVGEETDRQKQGGTIEQIADVWFDKLS